VNWDVRIQFRVYVYLTLVHLVFRVFQFIDKCGYCGTFLEPKNQESMKNCENDFSSVSILSYKNQGSNGIPLENYSPITMYRYAIIAQEIITKKTANHSLNNNQVVNAKIRIMAPISVSPVLAPIYSLIIV